MTTTGTVQNGFVLWTKRILIGLVILLIAAIASLMTYQKFSDGPTEILQGGPFKTGEIVDATQVDFKTLEGEPTELLLVGPGTSRTLGFIMHGGDVYITCDLGFIWNRLEDGTQKRVLNLIYIFKTWHEDAIADGRAELRIHGVRYPGMLELVEDETTIEALKVKIEALAREYLAPAELGPPPPPPNEMLFFRFDPVAVPW